METFGLVHHMDVFLCNEGITDTLSYGDCSTDAFTPHRRDYFPQYRGPKPVCQRLVFSFDKGAFGTYTLPRDYGIVVGQGTQFPVILFQIHCTYTSSKRYALPLPSSLSLTAFCCLQTDLTPPGLGPTALKERGYVDESHLMLHVVKGKPQNSVGAVTWRPPDTMAVPGSTTELFEYVSPCSALCVDSLLGRDLRKFGELDIVAVKLHAHDHAKKMARFYPRVVVFYYRTAFSSYGHNVLTGCRICSR